MPFDEIVESSEPVFDPVDLGFPPTPDVVSWPWPRLVVTSYHTFLFMEGAEGALFLAELTLDHMGGWVGTHIGIVGTISDTESVDVADFGHYYVVLVAGATTTRNFAKLIDTELVELVQPVFAVGCNNSGQFIGGNVSNWQNLGSDGIAWSAIGNYEFDPQVDITAGFRTLVSGRVAGKRVRIHKILPFVGGVIIYTDQGNIFLADAIVGSSFVYGLSELEGVGVVSSNHVAGNNYTQMFVNINNELCKYQRTKELRILGYKRQIEILKETQTPLIMTFLEDRNTFFLSNGVQTLVINDYGAGMIHQAISGIIKGWNEQIYATYRDLGDTEARITLDGNSFDSRGKKTFEWIIADINHLPDTSVVASAYWRNGASDEWRNYTWKHGSPSGEFFLGLSAVEYRAALRFSNYVESEIFALKANMKYPDSRARRGIAAISGVRRGEETEG
jgi:hypothetical protein